MSSKRFRTILRALHLVEAVFISLLVYSPLRTDATYLAIMQWVIIPAIVISGIAMWQQARLVKLFRPATSQRNG
jgi:thiosulfate reductase cytochrome b subunit